MEKELKVENSQCMLGARKELRWLTRLKVILKIKLFSVSNLLWFWMMAELLLDFQKMLLWKGQKQMLLCWLLILWESTCHFFVVNNNLNRMWKRCGLVNVASNYEGYYLLKFNNEEGMKYIMENGPWMINGVPLFVKKWEIGLYLGKPEMKTLPLWVNLYGVPLKVWNVQGLSELASGIGVSLTLDRATEERCLTQMGRARFARVLIEVSAEKSLPDEIIGLVPTSDGSPKKEVPIRAVYNWKPTRCSHCKVFGHTFGSCGVRPLSDDEKIAKLKKDELTRKVENGDDGFQMVGKKNIPVQVQSMPVMNRRVGTKEWVNQKFTAQKQKPVQGAGRQDRSGHKMNDNGGKKGQQQGGSMVWQAK